MSSDALGIPKHVKMSGHKEEIRSLHAQIARSPKPLISAGIFAKAIAFSVTALPVISHLAGQPAILNAVTTTAAFTISAGLATQAHDTKLWHEQAQVMVFNELSSKLEGFLRAECEAEQRRKTMSNLDWQFFSSNLWHALQALAASSTEARIYNQSRVVWLLSPITALPVRVIDHKEDGFDKVVEVNWPEVIKQLGLEQSFRLKRVDGANGGQYVRL